MKERDPKSLPPGRQPPWFKALVRGLVWFAYGGHDVEGIQRVPLEGPLIVASTHRSYLDPIILGAFLPRTLYLMAKQELFENRLLGSLIRAFGAFPVDRESVRGSTFRTALDLLRKGGAVTIFPEGGIVESLGGQGLKGGVGTLATLSGAPVLPVYVAGSNTLFSWREALSDSPWIAIRVGAPIDPGQERGRAARERIADLAAQALRALERDYLGSRGAPATEVIR